MIQKMIYAYDITVYPSLLHYKYLENACQNADMVYKISPET